MRRSLREPIGRLSSSKYDASVVGQRVEIRWTGEASQPWYVGTIADFSAVDERHYVKYDDGDVRWHNLTVEEDTQQLRWVDVAPAAKDSHPCQRGFAFKTAMPLMTAHAPTAKASRPRKAAKASRPCQRGFGGKTVAAPPAAVVLTAPPAAVAPTVRCEDSAELPEVDALWVQCDRCSRWRLLPERTCIDAEAEWFCEMNPDRGSNVCDAPEPSQTAEEGVYYVDAILAQRVRRGRTQYLIRWLGWSEEHDSWEDEAHIEDPSLVEDFLTRAATGGTPTTDVWPAAWAFVAACPSVGGRGLFARAELRAGQAICEYAGPWLPLDAPIVDGKYVLRIPDLPFLIDGNCDNSPYQVTRSTAIFANHSFEPNASLQFWPALSPGPFDLRGAMWLVATEPIPAGCEIRFNYEAGGSGDYWSGSCPVETAWRSERVPPPSSSASATLPVPALNVLATLR